jgi:peptide/nickel transport system substrate-binding protein
MRKRVLFIFAAVVLTLGIVLTGCTEEPSAGDPIELTVLIRNEDTRMQIGDYTSGVLEDLGFQVTRQYGTSSELGPIWTGDPELGLWHAYTGAWISTAVERDAGSNFGFFHTPLGAGIMGPLWAAYENTEQFYNDCEVLWDNAFSTTAERNALFERAMWDAMVDANTVWLDDRLSFSPARTDVHVAADSYGGISGSWLMAWTLHFHDESGVPIAPTGDLTMRAASTDVLTQPWNAVAGSNWVYDMIPLRATSEPGFTYDPTTGLQWPMTALEAEMTWVQGLPIVTDPDHTGWLTTSTVTDPIPVPPTAWYDFDATTGEFVTVGDGVTAKTKTVVRYPEDIFTRPLHDGSTLDEGDFLIYAIMQFVRADPNSPLYDSSWVPNYDAFMGHFKGVEFNFNPGEGYGLEVTTYDDTFALDAENTAGDEQHSWFPYDQFGQWTWHTVALGILAEQDLAACFSQAKATANTVEWMHYVDGPTLPILEGYLDECLVSGYIPFENVLGDYITQEEALARYANLDAFYTDKGHFWVAGGPYYVENVDSVGQVIELARHTAYPDDASRWFFTMDPVPTNPPEHTGAWIDVITLEIAAEAAAVSMLGSDLLDVYIYAIADADLRATCDDDPNIHYYESAGLFDEIRFNPSGPFFPGTGEINPFAIPEVREAMQYALDRDYVCGTIYQGSAIPKFSDVGSLSGDGVKYADILADIEEYYAYNFDTADAMIEEAMLAIEGVTRDELGDYYYAPPE